MPEPGNPQALNRYTYVRNRPLNYIDPSGHRETRCDYEGCSATQNDLDQAIGNARRAEKIKFYRDCAQGGGTGCPNVGEIAASVAAGFVAMGLLSAAPEAIGFILDKLAPAAGAASTAAAAACADGDCTNEIKAIAELSNKLDYLLGKATGNLHNIQRSLDMLRQMQRIGLPDNLATREYLVEHFTRVVNDSTNILKIQENGYVVRESLLMGPYGGLKVQSTWDGAKLITVMLFGGGH